ncbi:hypothetical protein AOLI_G00021240 [Acnodon oligacanthus]
MYMVKSPELTTVTQYINAITAKNKIRAMETANLLKGQGVCVLSRRRRRGLGSIPPANYSLPALPAVSPPTGSCPF